MRIPLILTSLLLVAGCEAAPPPQPKATPTGPSDFQQKVAALSEAERNIVFIRAIRDADIDCQGVTGAVRQPDMPTGELYYVAQCNDGAKYGVLLQREGTAKIISSKS